MPRKTLSRKFNEMGVELCGDKDARADLLAALNLINGCEVGRKLLRQIGEMGVSIIVGDTMSAGQLAGATWNAYSKTITVSSGNPVRILALYIAHEAAHAQQDIAGVGYANGWELKPYEHHLYTRLIEADAFAHEGLIAWRIREETGNDEVWETFIKDEFKDRDAIERALEGKSEAEQRGLIFRQWFFNDGKRGYYERWEEGSYKADDAWFDTYAKRELDVDAAAHRLGWPWHQGYAVVHGGPVKLRSRLFGAVGSALADVMRARHGEFLSHEPVPDIPEWHKPMVKKPKPKPTSGG